jgi:aspartate/glutamate racemase
MASNTPHHRLEAIVRGVRIPIISIFEAAANKSARIGAAEVLILGTAPTRRPQVFRKEFAKRGIEAAGPDDEAANRLSNIAKASSRNIVCLACTELPLAFPQQKTPPSVSHWKYETRKRSQALLLIRVYPCASVAKLPSSPITHTSTLPADPGKQSNFGSGS